MNERDTLFLTHILAAIADIESFANEGRSGFLVEQDLPALRHSVQRILATAQHPRDGADLP